MRAYLPPRDEGAGNMIALDRSIGTLLNRHTRRNPGGSALSGGSWPGTPADPGTVHVVAGTGLARSRTGGSALDSAMSRRVLAPQHDHADHLVLNAGDDDE